MCTAQGLAVTFLATRFGWDESDAEAIQNWMICIEMFFAAVGMLFAFPASEYQLGGAAAPGWRWDAFTHAVSITDAIEDIMLQVCCCLMQLPRLLPRLDAARCSCINSCANLVLLVVSGTQQGMC